MEKKFYIGCSGFYNRHWKGIFYPEKLPQSKWFTYYSRKFNSLELNTTFYRFPTKQSLSKWYKDSPEDFIFSVKAPKLITHMKKFNDCEQLLKDLYKACHDGLHNKLGCILFQFPPSMEYSKEKLDLILKNLNYSFTNVLEFRHKSWWTAKVYDKLNKKGIIFCSVDHPKLPKTIKIFARMAYVRLHGSPVMFYSEYSQAYLKKLYSKIRNCKTACIYFNNTAGNAGILNAQQFKDLIKDK
jgi:uncharacterized protein YecE (DUF72 family)